MRFLLPPVCRLRKYQQRAWGSIPFFLLDRVSVNYPVDFWTMTFLLPRATAEQLPGPRTWPTKPGCLTPHLLSWLSGWNKQFKLFLSCFPLHCRIFDHLLIVRPLLPLPSWDPAGWWALSFGCSLVANLESFASKIPTPFPSWAWVCWSSHAVDTESAYVDMVPWTFNPRMK